MSSSTMPRHRSRATALRPVVPGPPPDDVPQAHLPAAAAEVERVHELEREIEQLRTAMASRAVIEQAKGVLMLLTGCGEERSFGLLTHISSHTHRKVRDVAAELVASATGRVELPADVRAILRDACPPGSPAV
jgi:hypothetical protein